MLANIEAENTVLAGIIRFPDSFWAINSEELRSDDFQGPTPRKIMKAILSVSGDRKTPEFPLLLEALDGQGDAMEYVEKLNKIPVTVPQAIESAKIVKGLSTARKLQQVGATFITLAEEKRADSDGLMAEAESLLRNVRMTLPVPDRSPDPSDILYRIQNVKEINAIKLPFSSTLQQLTGGLQPGHLWVVGGFSSTGKTLFAVNIIYHALKTRKWVEVFSLEMTQEDYLIRLASIKSGVPQRTIKNRAFIGHDEVAAVQRAEAWIPTTSLRIYDTAYRLSDIRSKAIHQKETLGLDLMIVDFVQNVYDTGDEVKDARTTILELQNLAKELDCTVIALSQLSNEQAKAQNDPANKQSGYYTFKGSGAIRDAADIGIILKRDRYISPNILDCELVKNRHGEAQRNVPMRIDLRTGRMVEESDLSGEELD
jgi:replicative DNA helicase